MSNPGEPAEQAEQKAQQATTAPGQAVAHPSVTLPAKAGVEGLKDKWDRHWEDERTYAFEEPAGVPAEEARAQIYSIDTPPPTASGSLHVGHVFSYTQTDVIARYQRMRGKKVFYPLGWDDNGLPTERRVQNYFGVRCDPSVPYDPDFTPPEKAPKNDRDFIPVSRQNFIELCEQLAVEDEKVFEDLFRSLGLSVDWSYTYRTVDDTSRAVSQRAFLADLAAGHAYSADAPTMWDVTYRTAVAQAELEDRERPGAYHRVAFHPADGAAPIEIETTRPELIPAVAALVAHPDDERYQPYFGTTVRSPLFGVEVEVRAHELAKPDKGTGIAMVCTFGDLTDVTWWRELDLPTRAIVGRDGRLSRETPEWIAQGADPKAVEHYAELAGKTTFSARTAIVELLRASGDLLGEPREISHPVPFYEKGDKPLEVVTSRQWYIRNGGRDAELRQKLIERGRELQWHPEFMRARYENWVEGLNGDWLVSRQRYFGVPIPLWYRLDERGEPDYDSPLVPDEAQLPVDPAADVPAGYTAEQRGEPGGFIGDPDVLDTWATSSLTPLLLGRWGRDEDFLGKVYPFDLRPQGHDIIRTWLFATVVRANSLTDAAPWRHAALSGWILDPDRKKMSKSKGNVVVPSEILAENKPGYGPDAVRYWASSAKLGADTAYDVTQMQIGRRLAMKILNASKFALGLGTHAEQVGRLDLVTEALDRALLSRLNATVEEATRHFEAYAYAQALQVTESFFWSFTDDYVELVKARAYGGAGEEAMVSAQVTLATALDALLRLFAPVLPFATEETWSWWRSGSVHRQPWPEPVAGLSGQDADAGLLDAVATALSEVRRHKTEAKVSQRSEVARLELSGPAPLLELVRAAEGDLLSAGRVAEVSYSPADAEALTVTALDLAEQPAG